MPLDINYRLVIRRLDMITTHDEGDIVQQVSNAAAKEALFIAGEGYRHICPVLIFLLHW